ncbi:MAG TPA: squalene/phytoene synthase family protein [Gammaproteobacteria bacterium]|nr:squalene/phytoene synthase family protein [Gammaproteobacteria bacterium]
MPGTFAPEALLERLARSFALSLHLLPRPLREHFARAYLFARAADTVSDTDAVAPAARERVLGQLESAARRLQRGDPITLEAAPPGPGGSPEERTLMDQLPAVADWISELSVPARKRAGEVCVTLFAAMRRDLARFGRHPERVTALPDEAALDTYLYGNAGCVGAYWAQELATTSYRFTGLDIQSLERAGVHLGKALQRVNVLRDLARDLRRGRCYLPADRLAACGLEPRDLYFPDAAGRMRPLLEEQLTAARADLEAGLEFFHHLPHRWLRRRAAAALPAVLARRTLDRIAAEPHRILDAHDAVKVPRAEVKRLIARLLLLPPTDRGLERMVLRRG